MEVVTEEAFLCDKIGEKLFNVAIADDKIGKRVSENT